MAKDDSTDEDFSPSDRALRISGSAFQRLLTLRDAYNDAAARLRSEDDYPDFFVEGNPPWHERWPEVITGRRDFTRDRMLFLDRLGQDDYPDFFVEGSGDPWHERWPEVVTGLGFDPRVAQHRLRALKGLNVIEAFLRMRERAESR